MENAFTKTPAEALKHFGVIEQRGLSESQVLDARQKHGKNGMSGTQLSGGDDTDMPQHYQKTRLRPSGSSYWSSSKTSLLSSCSLVRP